MSRNQRRWKYIAQLDTDEMIIPGEFYKMTDFIQYLEKKTGHFTSFVLDQKLYTAKGSTRFNPPIRIGLIS